ncbi:MAG TPA: ABC-2 transporter permease [Ruminococcus sp.]
MSGKMRSLVYRELALSKKYYTVTAIAFLLFTGFFWLINMSFEFGNLSKISMEDSEEAAVLDMMKQIIFFMSVYMPPFMLGMLIKEPGIVISDIRSRWKTYSHALPVTPMQKLAVKYIIKIFMLAAALSVSILNSWLFCIASDRKMTSDMIITYIWIINLWLIADTITMPFMLRANTEKGVMLSNASAIIAIIPAFAGQLLLKSELKRRSEGYSQELKDSPLFMLQLLKEIISDFIDKIDVLAVPVMFILLAAGFFVNFTMIKRRER